MTYKERKALVIFCITLLSVGGLVSQTRLVRCVSGSLKGINYIFVLNSKRIKRGDIILIQRHKNPIISANMAKKVAGLPGDTISISNNEMLVERQRIGPLQPKTKWGKVNLPLFTWNLSLKVLSLWREMMSEVLILATESMALFL